MTYFWVYGRTKRDKPVLLGPYNTEPEADRLANQLEDSRVFPMTTKNQARATQRVKALLSETEGINRHMTNYNHQQGEEKNSSTVSGLEQEVWKSET